MTTPAEDRILTSDDVGADPAPRWPIDIRPNGTVLFDGIAIGGLDVTGGPTLHDPLATDEPRLTLNLGWMRLAGLHVRLQDDPDVDHHRDGIVLER